MKLRVLVDLFVVGIVVVSAQRACPVAHAQEPAQKAKAGTTAAKTDAATDPVVPAAADPVGQVITRMRDAQQRLAGRDTGKDTRDVQDQIIKKLEQLIELAKQQQSGASAQQQPEPSEEKPDADSKDKPRETDAQPPGSEKDRSGDKARPQDRKNTPRNKDARFEFRTLTREVWGHLPEKVRQRLSNRDTDKSVPKYTDLVFRYFEALAEESRREDEAN